MSATLVPEQTPWTPTHHAFVLAHQYFIICIVFMTLAGLFIIARIWTRCRAGFLLGADDYCSITAFAFVMTHSTLYLHSLGWIWKDDTSKLTLADSEDSRFYSVIAQPFWAWAMAFTKTSIALMLLRLEQVPFWRRFLWTMIALQITLGVYNMVTQLLQCTPLNLAWDLHENVAHKCWPQTAYKASSVTVQIVNVLTDWVFAALPISFLRKVQRPLRERIIISVLMGLGVFAGAASVVKIHPIIRLGKIGNFEVEYSRIGMWSAIEELVAFSCSCVPCLRAPFQRALEYLGIASSLPTSTYGRTYGQMYGVNSRSRSQPGVSSRLKKTPKSNGLDSSIIMKSMRTTNDGQSEEHILTPAAGKNEIWCTTEVRLEREDDISGKAEVERRDVTPPSWRGSAASSKDAIERNRDRDKDKEQDGWRGR
ncbi:hypothetical protein K458DRAFT_394471 [Lentithecium fluviatile CBS 122367]|uniref:Rhodopsin domain-containing protein n=1 Tax=Lentithecium fluviatile CBS 122367 TaxID=1168545 RepID=A0A6G1IKR1_9PLEO|nr:hypothetical protein K458DRAFT_394471 [Lentithecium fluviatile CBS 122367]